MEFIAENQGSLAESWQWRTRRKAALIEEIEDNVDSIGLDAALSDEAFAAEFVNGDIAQDIGMLQRRFLPGKPAMAVIHRWCLRKPEKRDEGVVVMMRVNDVRRLAKLLDAIDD